MSFFSSVYSGKALCDVPFNHLWEETPVTGKEFTDGKIVAIIRTDDRGQPIQAVKVRWTIGDKIVTDTMLHHLIAHVRIK